MGCNPSDAVARGASLLDVFLPGWFNRIDTSRLVISSPHGCICDQLFGDYMTGVHTLNVWPPSWYGFCCPTNDETEYVRLWILHIQLRGKDHEYRKIVDQLLQCEGYDTAGVAASMGVLGELLP